jgi:hypothetical protein
MELPVLENSDEKYLLFIFFSNVIYFIRWRQVIHFYNINKKIEDIINTMVYVNMLLLFTHWVRVVSINHHLVSAMSMIDGKSIVLCFKIQTSKEA